MKKRQYTTPAAKPAPHKGVAEQIGDGLMSIPRAIGAIPAGTVDFFSRAVAMAKNPSTAAQKMMEQPAGWKSIILDLIGLILILVICLGIIMAVGTLIDAKAAAQLPLPLVPAAALIVAFQLAPSLIMMVILASAVLHLMASIGGSKGAYERMAQMTVTVWSVLIPIILVVGIVSSVAGLPVLIGFIVMNVYLIYTLAKVMTAVYGMPFNRAIFMTFIYQLLMGILSFVAAQSLPTKV